MLKYLFSVEFLDGSIYKQTLDDISEQDSRRSAFYDIQQKLDQIKLFELFDGTHSILVDLTDGHFDIDGVEFYPHDGPVENIRLIYFRRHKITLNDGHEELTHDTIYRLGWQANEMGTGKNIQYVLQIK